MTREKAIKIVAKNSRDGKGWNDEFIDNLIDLGILKIDEDRKELFNNGTVAVTSIGGVAEVWADGKVVWTSKQ